MHAQVERVNVINDARTEVQSLEGSRRRYARMFVWRVHTGLS